MKNRIAFTVATASLLLSGAAVANTSSAALGGTTIVSADDDGPKKRQKRQHMGQNGQNGQEGQRQQRRSRSEASTSTSGVAVTTRRGGAAAIDTRGMARGDGSVQSSSEGEVFSSTTRDGSDADAFGRSDASAEEPRRQRRRPQ